MLSLAAFRVSDSRKGTSSNSTKGKFIEIVPESKVEGEFEEDDDDDEEEGDEDGDSEEGEDSSEEEEDGEESESDEEVDNARVVKELSEEQKSKLSKIQQQLSKVSFNALYMSYSFWMANSHIF